MAKKSFKKFAGTGKLKEVISSRRSFQKSRKLIEGREKRAAGKAREFGAKKGVDDVDEPEEESEAEEDDKKRNPKSVDDIMGAAFMEDSGDEGAPNKADSDDDDEEDLNDTDDDFAGVDDLDDMEKSHVNALSQLSKTDPEFFKYLQENDKELLEFGASTSSNSGTPPPPSKKASKRAAKLEAEKKAASKGKAKEEEAPLGQDEYEEFEGGDSDEDEEEEILGQLNGKKAKKEQGEMEVVTLDMLKGWQKNMLETRSLKSLRRLHLAFRAAAYSNSDASDKASQSFAYEIEDASVFNKIILTTLHYTPQLLSHHLPLKLSAQTGKFKLTKQPPPALMKMIMSYMSNLMHLVQQLPDDKEGGGLLKVCLKGAEAMVPWIVGGRKIVKNLLKMLLEQWSSASDSVRIASFLAIRKLVQNGDEGVREITFKGLYLTFLRSCKQTTVHTLPAINLMKNSASEIYNLDPATAYQHAFGYIRQLAVHLRNSIKVQSKDAYKAVYNWQFVHCIDFWCLVMSTACSRDARLARGGQESELQPLIYPLVQITLGVIRLIPTSRYFPLRFHVVRSLLRLSAHTNTYIPLTPSLLEPLSSAEFTSKPKPSTLSPLDFEYVIRAPTAYPRTKIYQDGLAEEIAFILLEHQAQLSTSIAFPELAIPIVSSLKRFVKKGTKNAKASGLFKVLLEKIDMNAKWVGEKRKSVEFAPNDRSEVDGFLEGVKVDSTPLGQFWKLQKKVRDAKRREIEKAAREERGPEEDDSDGQDDEGSDDEGEFDLEDEDEEEGEIEMEDDE
ncbi:Predicted protein involved in nuclear export of pre-ribosomes [Phaffia rhodozyma]|uniref:Noc2-domain-containing protein n=1 Tax=Phaffia rhodozyma TaxID=264483 RepID=A0A0F7SXM1_PHARH|nr:Predicted protein involved in nuclear export of pre-ribosomes [Phaffia rhodozyma]